MEIILFWVLGALSLTAAGFAMLHPRPARAATALSLAMAANGGICLVLGQYLLGLEVLLLLTAGALFLRAFLRGREILQIHTGGRPRWSLARVSGAAAAVAFLWLLLPLLSDLERPRPIESGDTFAAAWIALLALLSAGLTGAWVIHARRGQNGGPAT